MIATLCVVAFLVYLNERSRPLIHQWLAARARSQTVRPATRLPVDLQMQAQGYSDQWARADAEKRFRELYEEMGGDWDQVRAMTGGGN